VDYVDQVQGMKGVGLAGTGCAAALVDPADGTTFTEHYSASSQSIQVLGMPHPDARDICDGIVEIGRHVLSTIPEKYEGKNCANDAPNQ
jgi:hypothetical protein